MVQHWESMAGDIDEGAIRTWIEARLDDTAVTETPFRHLIVRDVFPPAFYERLRAAWPPTDAFKSDGKGRKYDLVPLAGADGVDARASGYARLPAETRRLWDFWVFTVNRTIVGPKLRQKFDAEIDERLTRIRDASERGVISYSMARAADGEPAANVGRFMMRGPGFELRPHVDSMPYVVTVLHYFPDAEVEGADGTVLYQAAAPLDFERCVRSGSTEYFDAAGIATREVMRVPFEPNILVAFPNALDAAHGAVAPEQGLRRLFQYHLSLKGDHEKV